MAKMGSNYACLFVGYIEHQIRGQYTGFIPQLHKRYMDDNVGVASCRREELEAFIDFVSNFHPALQFTSTITETGIPFWTSTYAFLMIGFKPPSTTRKQIPTTTSNSLLSILMTAIVLSLITASFSTYVDFALTTMASS